MAKNTYKRELWIYSVLVIISFICAGMGGPIWASIDLNSIVVIILGIAAFLLFLFATIRFGLFLELTSTQWLVTILLLMFIWPASIIYILTRKPSTGV